MSHWSGSIYCLANDGLYSLQYPGQDTNAIPVTRVIAAEGPQVLPMPSRPLSDEQLSAWFRAWRRAGYEFRNAG
jgi:hypothetical protein